MAQRLDGSQAILNSSAFDAYGVESATSTPIDPFGYNAQSGYLLDRDTGLYLCEHRYYDAATGRWITRDPIGYEGGINLYGYTSGNPMGRSDLDGFDWIEYTGQQYSWYKGNVGDHRNAVFSVPATSGGIGLQSPNYVGVKASNTIGPSGGPIPEGLFEINLRLNPTRVAKLNATGFLVHGYGIQQIPTDARGQSLIPNWGTWRARLQPLRGNMHGRDSMYLHDSGKGFSHGCVECTWWDGLLVLKKLIEYRNSGHTSIRFLAKYVGNSTRGKTSGSILFPQ